MTTALITGATAGIGLEFAHQLADRGYDLVLVARARERLDAVAIELRSRGISVDVLVADLLDAAGLDAVDARVSDAEHPVDLLVNNAGYGIRGELYDNTWHDERRHLEIHATVPLRLTQSALTGMLARGRGRVVLVASVAAFTPRGTYSAAKAWAVMLARSLNLRTRDHGVTVTAVCPGFTRTEFHERMGVETAGIPEFLWLDARQLVRIALRGVDRGRSVVVPTLRYRIISGIARALPDRWSAGGRFRSRD